MEETEDLPAAVVVRCGGRGGAGVRDWGEGEMAGRERDTVRERDARGGEGGRGRSGG